MIQSLLLTQNDVLQTIWRLHQRAYRVEANLIGFPELPPLIETIEKLARSKELFLGYVIEGEILGAAAYEWHDNNVTIARLIVDPDHFREGIGCALLKAVIVNTQSADQWFVSTAKKNAPAIKLYESYGFKVESERIVREGLTLVEFKKDKEIV
ncbi:GNAT family N-acetyltransferase [Jeotgalibacillus soli]|uniref:N-acetyltransferase domain-containing protein n=1 Tax=Jeotgalibacillus soli TaxID=889306 RepID=A0A0C2W6B2_9BACL|nr:GNAT family N-acetyltransferase [Jeotgalibacillus soli]KIL52111.1 hypothetical protein KP78_04810 [Jeotgalibacillus soli]